MEKRTDSNDEEVWQDVECLKQDQLNHIDLHRNEGEKTQDFVARNICDDTTDRPETRMQ